MDKENGSLGNQSNQPAPANTGIFSAPSADQSFLAEHPAQTIASGTGDIILKSAKTPSNKKPLLIAILIAVAVLAILGVILFLLANRPVSQEELASTFAEYQSLIVDGPAKSSEDADEEDSEIEVVESAPTSTNNTVDYFEDEDEGNYEDETSEEDSSSYDDETYVEEVAPEAETDFSDENGTDFSDEDETDEMSVENTYELPYDNWYLVNLETKKLSYEEQEKYISSIMEKYKAVESKAKLLDKNTQGYEEIKSQIQQNGDLLRLTSLWSMFLAINDELERVYLTDGKNDAEKFISKTLGAEPTDENTLSTYNLFKQDLDYELSRLEIYSQNNCYDDNTLDLTCQLSDAAETSMTNLVKEQNDNYRGLARRMFSITDDFYKQVISISNSLGSNHE